MLDFNAHIINEWNHLRTKQIFVSCSAGVDSTVLAVSLKRLGFHITVIHMNYQLRGIDSDLDALFVKAFCRKEGITCLQKTVDLQSQLKNGGNLQEIARNERYNWFQHIIQSDSNNFVALGHHQDDQIETFFLNLGRKAGIMGLACMMKEHNRIIRPLLEISRAEIIDYAKSNGIEWREDQSNASNKYRRNLLRNVIIPEIKTYVPGINQSVLKLIETFQTTQTELSNKIAPLTVDFSKHGSIEISQLKTCSDSELIEFLRQSNQPASSLEDLKKLCNAQKGKKLKWGDHWLFNEGNHLIKHPVSVKTPVPEFSIKTVSTLPTVFNKKCIYLDAEKIEGELNLRMWKKADRIHPIGMKGSKLVSDVISDAKLHASQKASVMVLHDRANIHWVSGLVIGRKAIANTKTGNILQVTISEAPLK